MIAPASAKKTRYILTINTEEMLPYNFTANSGEIIGINVDIVKVLFEKLNVDYEMNLYPWTRAYKKTLSHENNGLISTARTPNREGMFKWVGPLASGQGYLYKLKSRGDIQLTSLDDAKNYSVAIVRGGVYQNLFENLGFKVGENLMPFSYSKQYFQPFLLGKVDLILGSDIVLPYILQKIGINIDLVEPAVKMIDTKGNYLALNMNTPDEVVERLNNELQKMKDSGEFQKIIDSYNLNRK
jgi:polar amino acid transport system substrate-binding protein